MIFDLRFVIFDLTLRRSNYPNAKAIANPKSKIQNVPNRVRTATFVRPASDRRQKPMRRYLKAAYAC
jgi:hypothetical protein